MSGECSRGGVLQEGDVVVLRVLSVVESRHHVKPEPKFRLWKRPCLCLEAQNLDDCASKQIHVRIPPPKQTHAAGDHVREMPGLVVVMAGGGNVGGQNMVEANGGMEVVGCEGASRLPRKSRHNRHAS